jgi:hypothetical protein
MSTGRGRTARHAGDHGVRHIEMTINRYVNLTGDELDLTAWRYFAFSKFISLITYGALWFPKLKILKDEFEGTLPEVTETEMRQENEKQKMFFNTPEFHKQIDEWPSNNVRDGRELTVVNCWFLDEVESKRMWNEYVGHDEGVAVKSTVRKLAKYVYAYPDFSHMGKVKYVDHKTYMMSMYEAHQAHERAFIKDSSKFSHEQELRISSMNIKTPMCLNMDGRPLTREECSGKNMNNFENPGLYIRVNLENLINEIVLAPNASEWFELLVKRIAEMSKFGWIVTRSRIEHV